MLAENTAAIRELIAAINATQTALQSPGARAYAQAKALVLEPEEPVAEPEPEKKPKRQRAEKPAPATEPPPEPEAPAVEVTYEQIRQPFLTQLVAKKGRDAGAALLREFGVPDGGKLSDIPQARWPEVLTAINAQVFP